MEHVPKSRASCTVYEMFCSKLPCKGVSWRLCTVQVSWLKHKLLEWHSKPKQKPQKAKEKFRPAAHMSLNLEKLRNTIPCTLKQNEMTLKEQPVSGIRSFCSIWDSSSASHRHCRAAPCPSGTAGTTGTGLLSRVFATWICHSLKDLERLHHIQTQGKPRCCWWFQICYFFSLFPCILRCLVEMQHQIDSSKLVHDALKNQNSCLLVPPLAVQDTASAHHVLWISNHCRVLGDVVRFLFVFCSKARPKINYCHISPFFSGHPHACDAAAVLHGTAGWAKPNCKHDALMHLCDWRSIHL